MASSAPRDVLERKAILKDLFGELGPEEAPPVNDEDG